MFKRLSIHDPASDPAWTVELAPLADRAGYHRYWLGEHHDHAYPSGSPELLTAILAGLTQRIRVGPGGVLLPYYSPFKVAQSFRLLESLFPGRIDLALGRGTGTTDQAVSAALRDARPETFNGKVRELALLLSCQLPEDHPLRAATESWDESLRPEVWILASTSAGAETAARAGLPLCFLTDREPGRKLLETYLRHFVPGAGGGRPRWAVQVSGLCADGAGEARKALDRMTPLFASRFVGTPDECVEQLAEIARDLEAEELVVNMMAPSGEEWCEAYVGLARAARLG